MPNFFPFDPRPGAINEFPPNAQRVVDVYREVRSSLAGMDLAQLEYRIYGMDFGTERVLATPRALGAPFGATAKRQWVKRERIHARLRIARNGH